MEIDIKNIRYLGEAVERMRRSDDQVEFGMSMGIIMAVDELGLLDELDEHIHYFSDQRIARNNSIKFENVDAVSRLIMMTLTHGIDVYYDNIHIGYVDDYRDESLKKTLKKLNFDEKEFKKMNNVKELNYRKFIAKVEQHNK